MEIAQVGWSSPGAALGGRSRAIFFFWPVGYEVVL